MQLLDFASNGTGPGSGARFRCPQWCGGSGARFRCPVPVPGSGARFRCLWFDATRPIYNRGLVPVPGSVAFSSTTESGLVPLPPPGSVG